MLTGVQPPFRGTPLVPLKGQTFPPEPDATSVQDAMLPVISCGCSLEVLDACCSEEAMRKGLERGERREGVIAKGVILKPG